MSRTRIKICGITSADDAQQVCRAGADALGLVFYAPSPRAVDIATAREIAAAAAPFVQLVGLFVNEQAERIEEVLAQVPLHTLQFHGDESPDFCRQFQRPWLKALRVKAGSAPAAACQPYREASAILLDSWQEGVPGGTGKAFDWQQARGEFPMPVVLAGGLNADNVGQGIQLLRPAAVDVSGGVESAPGRKDPGKVRAFIAAVRAADELQD
ncbi:phosphoribosylanthranilate isomerase [Parahaliea aestuarii]|uniref:N-(5'-phosphoribosyl)anthranilate isomerase n=1 Tax=Parahaliea aestuarii TaxID=1852021 RepID=A0A5C8ZTD0_9GAMM|nr:phosphoribosylanthranilate isomerase [Parahaliea aestuarii]TXS91039.1 phosphoribosylanthranilate isomerase [Parahaliea aestuarii]